MQPSLAHFNPLSGPYNLRTSTTTTTTGAAPSGVPNPIEKRPKLSQPDRSVASKAKEILPESDLFFRLCELEHQLDSRILRKQVQMADASFKLGKAKRLLKIYVTSSWSENETTGSASTMSQSSQSVTAMDVDSGTANGNGGSWTLRIEGRLEGGSNPSQSHQTSSKSGSRHAAHPQQQQQSKKQHQFSTFIKSLIVDVNNGGEVVEWRKSANTLQAETDGFEIKRRAEISSASGELSLPVRIALQMDWTPERFRLSPALAALIVAPGGSNSLLMTKPAVVVALWQYIKIHKLQESDEKKIIKNDAALQALFNGVAKMSFGDIPVLVEPHLLPPEPIVIDYEITNSGSGSGGSMMGPVFVHEVEVDVDDLGTKIQQQMTMPRPSASTGSTNTSTTTTTTAAAPSTAVPSSASTSVNSAATIAREVATLNSRIRDLVDALRASHQSLALLRRFAANPLDCCHRLLSSALADYETIVGDVPVTLAEMNRSEFYGSEAVEQAVNDLLAINPRYFNF